MRASVGDRVTIHGRSVGMPERSGEVIEVRGDGDEPCSSSGTTTATRRSCRREATARSITRPDPARAEDVGRPADRRLIHRVEPLASARRDRPLGPAVVGRVRHLGLGARDRLAGGALGRPLRDRAARARAARGAATRIPAHASRAAHDPARAHRRHPLLLVRQHRPALHDPRHGRAHRGVPPGADRGRGRR